MKKAKAKTSKKAPARFAGNIGMVGPGKEVPHGGTPSAKKTSPLGKPV